jgi:hypothetical protein
MKNYIILILLIAATGCKKYAEAPLIQNASYIRVFNDLPLAVDPLHTGQAAPFLTFVMDPQMGANNVADSGAVIGDFLGTRELYSLSYPINEADNSVGHTTLDERGDPVQVSLNPINFEYPGNAHVLTAPAMNGFDLSAWAAVPGGKHRIMFVLRPQNSLPFTQLSVTIRNRILIDTVVDFEPGEVYTMEVVSQDLDRDKYGLYVRREAFIHQSFEENKLYVGFVNLSGVEPRTSKYGFTNMFSAQTNIYYTYNIYDDVKNASQTVPDIIYNPLPGYDHTYYTTLNTRMDTVIPFLALPLLPESSFFRQDTLRTYMKAIPGIFNIAGFGTLPHFEFDLRDAQNIGPSFNIRSSGDPRIFNHYDVNVTRATKFTPNLNLAVNTGSAWHIYSTLNIMEMVYDRVYMMQIQRAFNEVPKN